MATLADSFLQDLEDLEDDEPEQQATSAVAAEAEVPDEDEEEILDAVAEFERAQVETVAVVSNLSSQETFLDLIREVRRKTDEAPKMLVGVANEADNVLDEEEYALIDKSNQLVVKLDTEIMNVHSFIRDIYSKKFPELESIVFNPLEYIAVVQRIKNETDLIAIELADILPNTITMAVTVAGSMTTGQPLPPGDLEKVLKAAEEAIHLADCRKDVLGYLESRMGVLAPNVSAIIGSSLAARLITQAQGVINLARMPSQNIMLIGSANASSKSTTGTSILGGATTASSGSSATRSVVYGCDIIQGTPLAARNRALKLVAGKLGLAARVDSFHESPTGEVGRALRDKIIYSLMKAQEPPPAPLKKSLPVPDDAPKSRRGGKRYRKSKEKYGLSEFRKEANRLPFGPEAEEEVDAEGKAGLGMATKGFGQGKLRLQTKQLRVQVKRQKRQQKQMAGTRSVAGGITVSSGATGGMSSSLVFTPLQGIELCNPDAALAKPMKTKREAEDYFSPAGTFVKAENKISTA